MGEELTTPCRFCDEPIRAAARACPYCGQDLKDTPSAMPLSSPLDTAAWLELFTQPEVVTHLNQSLRGRRPRTEILATGPETIGEAVFGIASMLGLHVTVHHHALRVIVKDLGIEASWAAALQVMQLRPAARRRAFAALVRRKNAPPDADQDS
jgi:hypothetical protein